MSPTLKFNHKHAEFGRRLNAKPGFIVSRVEYNKRSGGRNIAIVQAGADLFVRTVWMPTKWSASVVACCRVSPSMQC